MIQSEDVQIANSKRISLRKASVLILVMQVIFLLLFAIFTNPNSEYIPKINAMNGTENIDFSTGYNIFTCVAIMIFVGFGYLMTSLANYGVAAVVGQVADELGKPAELVPAGFRVDQERRVALEHPLDALEEGGPVVPDLGVGR